MALADLCCQGLVGSGLPAVLPRGNFFPYIHGFCPILWRYVGFSAPDLVGGGRLIKAQTHPHPSSLVPTLDTCTRWDGWTNWFFPITLVRSDPKSPRIAPFCISCSFSCDSNHRLSCCVLGCHLGSNLPFWGRGGGRTGVLVATTLHSVATQQ